MRKVAVCTIAVFLTIALLLSVGQTVIGQGSQGGPLQALEARVATLEAMVRDLLARVQALELGGGGSVTRTVYTKIIDPLDNGEVVFDYPPHGFYGDGSFTRAHFARFIFPDCSLADPPIVHMYQRRFYDPARSAIEEQDAFTDSLPAPPQYHDLPDGAGLEMLVEYKIEYLSVAGDILYTSYCYNPEDDGTILLKAVVVH